MSPFLEDCRDTVLHLTSLFINHVLEQFSVDVRHF